MRTLVTGGAGFIGRSVANDLNSLGHEVTVFDLEPLEDPFCDFRQGSIDSAEAVGNAVKGHETIVHAAALVGVETCFRDPQLLLDINIRGTLTLIEAAAAHDVKNICFLSSSEVYGDGRGIPFSEIDPPSPKTLYGYSKLFGEIALKAFALERGVQVTVVRLFNIYGPRQRKDFVVRTFIGQALNSQPITVFGDGRQIRTFTYIDDAAAGIRAAIQRDALDFDKFEIFNIGSTQCASALELAHIVKELTQSESPIVIVPLTESATARNPAQEILYRIPNLAKTRARLGFEARITLREGLARVISVMREQTYGLESTELGVS